MGVADNKTYKNTTHFNGRFRGFNTVEDNPSVHHEPRINTTIGDNDERANVEVEEDELILKPDLSAIFKARGKKHSQGGIDVLLEPETFIFSDDRSLGMTRKQLKMLELEGYDLKSKNTPANILKKNVDVKHYNTLFNILNEPFKDDLAKKTSALMLEKYIDMVGQVAYAQEKMKGLPDGVPEFSKGAAPIYEGELKENIMQQKQYAKYGGMVKAQSGGFVDYLDEWWNKITGSPTNAPQSGRGRRRPPSWGKPATTPAPVQTPGVIVPDTPGITSYRGDRTYKGNASKYSDQQWQQFAKDLGFSGNTNREFQQFLFNMNGDVGEDGSLKPNFQDLIISLHQKYGNPKAPPQPDEANNWFDARLGHRWDIVMDEYYKTKPKPEEPYTNVPEDYTTPDEPPKPKVDPRPEVPGIEGDPQGPIEANWRFTPWQRVSQGHNAAKYAALRRYMPMRSRYSASYIDPALVNPEQIMGDLRSSANAQTAAVRGTQNPIVANAQAAGIYGQLLDQMPGVRSQYDNQNAQIQNVTRAQNNQTRNQESLTNMQNDQNYYKESVIGRQNFENMRSFLGDQYMNNVLRDVETNQSLAYNMLTLNNPAYGYNWKSGNFTRKPVDILDVQGSGTQDIQNQYLQKLLANWDNLESKDQVNLMKIMTMRGFQPTNFKKGGKFRNVKKSAGY